MNDNLVSYEITNARCVDLDGTGGGASTDGINFYGTIIQSANINGGRKVQLTNVNECSFNNVYWDGSSVVDGNGKDIRIESNCNNISFNGGASLGLQRIENACATVHISDPRKGTYLTGGIGLNSSSSGAAGMVGKWIYQQNNWPDGETVAIPVTTRFLIVSANSDVGVFNILADGTVSLMTGSANMFATDVPNKFCVYNDNSTATIKNNLGISANVRAEFTNF